MSLFRRKRMGSREIVWLLRQLATLVSSGVPLVQALTHLERDCGNEALAVLLSSVRARLQTGQALSEAMQHYPRVFDQGLIHGIAAGELGGMLDDTLQRLALEREKRLRLQGRVRLALMYPLSILLMAGVVIAIMVSTVIPAFGATFAEFGKPLPAATRRVVSLARFLTESWEGLLAGLVLTVGVLRRGLNRYPGWQRARDRVMLRLPWVGKVVMQATLARWARLLSLLVSAGVPLTDALDAAGTAAGNWVYRDASRLVRQRIRGGMSLSDAMRVSGGFPRLVVQMAAVGEASGALGRMFEQVAVYNEEQVEQSLAILACLLEPLSLLILGGLCGALIWALYLPVFEIGQVVA
jgi:type IV pilus assembly protein PilC